MRNIKKLLTLTYLFLVLFSYPAAAAVRADSEKFQFQLSVSGAEELLPGDISEQSILVKNNTGKNLAYMVEQVDYTGSEVLAQYLEICILDGDERFLYGTVKELSDRESFGNMLRHPAGEDRSLRLQLRLRKEAPNAVSGKSLTAAIHIFGTDAPIEERDPTDETEEVKETKGDYGSSETQTQEPQNTQTPQESQNSQENQTPPSAGTQDVENANDGSPSGGSQAVESGVSTSPSASKQNEAATGRDSFSAIVAEGYDGKQNSISAENPPSSLLEQLYDWAARIRDYPGLWTETAVQPFLDVQAEGTQTEDAEEISEEASYEASEYSDRRRSRGTRTAASQASQREAENAGPEEDDITEDDITAKLSLRILDVTKKTASVSIRADSGDGSREPMTLYIGPSGKEKMMLFFGIVLVLLLLLLIILKCFLLYRDMQEKEQEDRAHVSKEQRA